MFAATVAFLEDLKENNDRDWFEARRDRYERDVREPAFAFVDAIAPRLHAISPHFRAIGKGRGSSVSRIARDTRFSADKSPYKDYLGFHFAHESGKGSPGFHLHVSPTDTGVGLGVWMLEPADLKRVRDEIARPGSEWGAVRATLDGGGYRFIGDSLKRVPKGFDADHPHAEDLKRKTFGAGRPVDPELPAGAFVDEVERGFRDGLPLILFLCRALGLPT